MSDAASATAIADGSCAACGGHELEPHLKVAGASAEAGLIPTTDRYGTALADVVRCTACGHMQLERMPAEAELAEAYGEAESIDYVDEEAGQRATARALLDEIERQLERGSLETLVEPGSLLDLGCWVGFVLAEARARGWRTQGVEPSAWASAYARDELGLDVRAGGLFETPLPAGAYGAIVLGDVIEHLPRAGEALDRIAGALAPGGVLALALPDAGSRLARAMGARWWSVLPTHVHYFTRASMRTMLERHGYEVVAIRTAPKTFSVAYYLGRLGGYRAGLGSALVGTARRLGIAERPWTPDFRDRMLVIARRRR